MVKKIKVLSSKVVYRGKWVEVTSDKIVKPDGVEANHEVARRGDCVLILAFEGDKLLLVKQWRYPANESLWELPSGFINKSETPLKAARRELQEESGLIPLKIKSLGVFLTWPSFSTQKIFLFYANKFRMGKISHDKTESDLKSRFIPYKQVLRFVKKGTMKTSSTLAALAIMDIKQKKVVNLS